MKLTPTQRHLIRTALEFGAASADELARWAGVCHTSIWRIAGFRVYKPLAAFRLCWGQRAWDKRMGVPHQPVNKS